MKHLNYGLAMTVDPQQPYGILKDGRVIHYDSLWGVLEILDYWLREYDRQEWFYSEPEKLLLPGELL